MRKLIPLLIAVLVLAVVFTPRPAISATDSAFSFVDATAPVNPQYTEYVFQFIQAASSPTAFSHSFTEPTKFNGTWDTIEIAYQSSSGDTEIWSEATTYTYADMDLAVRGRDSLQATLTGAFDDAIVIVVARDYYGL